MQGGKALVQAESENADVSQMQVKYGSGTCQMDSSGRVAMPLANTGEQQMTLVYGDTTDGVTIDVKAQQNQQEGGSAFSPGFGLVTALIAVFVGVLLIGVRD